MTSQFDCFPPIEHCSAYGTRVPGGGHEKRGAAMSRAPVAVLVYEALVDVGPTVSLGGGACGERRIVNITGGEFNGPRIRGKVLPGGADRQLVRVDGVLLLDALYEIQANDGTVLP